MEKPSDSVQKELVFMNLVESIQKLCKLLDRNSNFDNLDKNNNYQVLLQKCTLILNSEENNLKNLEDEIFQLKKNLYEKIKLFEENIKNKKKEIKFDETPLLSPKNIEIDEKIKTLFENENFKLIEKEKAIEKDIENLKKKTEKFLISIKELEKENFELENKLLVQKTKLEKTKEELSIISNRKNEINNEIKQKTKENTLLITKNQRLENLSRKLNQENPIYKSYSNEFIKEIETMQLKNEELLTNLNQINIIKTKLEENLIQKEHEYNIIMLHKNKFDTSFFREETITEQIKLESEIHSTLMIENDVLKKQLDFLSDKSSSNSLIFLMNEDIANKLSKPDLENSIDFIDNLKNKKNSFEKNEQNEIKKNQINSIDSELKEKRNLANNLRMQINLRQKKEKNNNNLESNKLNYEITSKIIQIESLLDIAEADFNTLKQSIIN